MSTRDIQLRGSDSLYRFGGLFEGGYHVQQDPCEAAAVLDVIRTRVRHPRLLEIGSASGGFSRLLDDELCCTSIHVVDDNQHPKAQLRKTILPHAEEFIGKSHDSDDWLAEHGPYDLAVIDADHSYAGVRGDTERVLPHLADGAVIVYHDTLNTQWGVNRLVAEMKQGMFSDVVHIADIGKRHGLAVFRKAGEMMENPAPPPVPAMLLYHFCGWLKRPEMIDFHVDMLRRYLPMFSKVRINIVTGEEFLDANTVKAKLSKAIATDDVRFFETPNDGHGEVNPFFQKLLPEATNGDMVFYGHTKGAIRTKPMAGAMAWTELMWTHCCSNLRAIDTLLDRHPCVGPFQLDATSMKSRWGNSQWHYGGTFFWFRDIRRHTGWWTCHPNRYGLEGWLGNFIPKADACNLIDESVRQKFRYDGPGLKAWEALQ
jgi:hypothetical protein